MTETDIPDWLRQLTAAALQHIETVGPIGYRAGLSDEWECWMVEIYPGAVLERGEETFAEHFIVDLGDVAALCDVPPGITASDRGALIEGKFGGHEFVVEFLWEPPDDVEPVAEVNPDGSVNQLVGSDKDPLPN